MSEPLLAYLDMLFGGEPDGGLIEVRCPPSRGRFIDVRDLEGAAGYIIARGRETNTYVGAAPRVHYMRNGRQFGGKEAVERVHVLWVDADDPESVEGLDDFEPQPSMVVRTSTGNRQALWALASPVSRGKAERGNRLLALALGADTSAVDAARVLRPPGTLNHKPERRIHNAPPLVVLERVHMEIFGWHDVIADVPDPDQDQEPRPVEPGDFLRNLPPHRYVAELTGIDIGRATKISCPLPDHDDSEPSFHVYPTADDGWFCYGCNRGGDVYTLAALLAGGYRLPLRGSDFLEVEATLLSFYEARLLPR